MDTWRGVVMSNRGLATLVTYTGRIIARARAKQERNEEEVEESHQKEEEKESATKSDNYLAKAKGGDYPS